jgi:hypothetical protein
MKEAIRFFIFLILLGSLPLQARETEGLDVNQSNKKSKTHKTLNELCQPSRASSELNINNIRTTIHGGGDMWWDLVSVPRYEVPKGSGRHSMFAGALWLGGVDEGNQLKLAAQTYRQRGNDFWTGPLTTDGTASVTLEVCERYDQHWLIFRPEVELHRAWLICKDDPDCDESVEYEGYVIPRSILTWPGNGADAELDYMLAPFIDQNGDGIYDPEFDYPAYDLDNVFDCRLKETDLIYGDQTLWWVYNDRGNIHTQTTGGALGFEIRAQAFSFTTNDELNNMTFNNFRILNKSTFRLTDTYFGSWFDSDLGDPRDDLTGCDIPRGLGYVYNANPFDAGPFGYGNFPPALGVDFFQGPFADYFDGRDNDRDGCIDAVRDLNTGICIPEDPATGVNERIIMSGFMYYMNGAGQILGDPVNAVEYYNYLRSKWRNGSDLIIDNPSGPGNNANGNGFVASGIGEVTLFAFPGVSFDTTGVTAPTEPAGLGWFESPENMADKRGLHCAGPFSLAPGALNFITTGTVWARDLQNDGLFASVERLIFADDKAQSLFDNCFQVLNGPDAPDMEIVELNRELIINLTYGPTSNNIGLSYREEDITIPTPDGKTRQQMRDSIADYFDYVFEGFQVFQLRNANVSIGDLYDPSQARLIAQCDIRNNITQLINWDIDPNLNQLVPKDMTIQANNNGIRTSFRVLEDQFSTGLNRSLINQKDYFFTVVAYAQNQFIPFDPAQAPDGQRIPFLAGRRNIRTYTGLPHISDPKNGGTIVNANHGDRPQITLLDGIGNGANFTDFTQETEDSIVAFYKANNPVYQINRGPIDLKVVDPLGVPPGDFLFRFTGVTGNDGWEIQDLDGNIIAESGTTLSVFNEELIPAIGMSVSLNQTTAPGGDVDGARNNGFVGAELIFLDESERWLDFIRDRDDYTPYNWVLAGSNTNNAAETAARIYTDYGGDGQGVYGNILGGAWAPFGYTSAIRRSNQVLNTGETPIWGMGPSPSGANRTFPSQTYASRMHSVDVVFTPDHTKWTRVPVLEMQDNPTLAEGGAPIFTLRRHHGWSKDANGTLIPDPDNPGWSYFPGYAIDLETGERLNMAFGENSWMARDRGNDCLWNPTAREQYFPSDAVQGGFSFAGQHYIYVFHPDINRFPGQPMPYQGDRPEDNPFYEQIKALEQQQNSRLFWASAMWVSIPKMAPKFTNMNPYTEMPTEARVKLRVARPYANSVRDSSNFGNPYYQFSLNELAPKTRRSDVGKDALSLIKAVPNPYYGISAYEASQLDNNVKITNLPQRCDISIFSTNGTLIRRIRKDNSMSFAMWDLRNDYNVPIASGIYIIHIDAFDLGEHVIKWMGAMRPVDLNAF